MHSINIPATIFTNNSVHTLKPVLTGSPFLSLRLKLIIIGIPQASGKREHIVKIMPKTSPSFAKIDVSPCKTPPIAVKTQPKIININATLPKLLLFEVLLDFFSLTSQPQ